MAPEDTAPSVSSSIKLFGAVFAQHDLVELAVGLGSNVAARPEVHDFGCPGFVKFHARLDL